MKNSMHEVHCYVILSIANQFINLKFKYFPHRAQSVVQPGLFAHDRRTNQCKKGSTAQPFRACPPPN
jgi:hypothetical protein